MSGIGLLVLDLLVEIMFLLPSDIEQKFAFSQVSRHWRDVAVHNCLFWSSFAGHHSKADCYRVPIILERSGSSTLLHIQFRFRHHTAYVTHALNALVPYAARIEKLDIRFPRHLRGKPIEALLASNLEFLALQTLRLKYLQYVGIRTPILLTAPQLRVLDLEDFEPVSWETLLSPSLENICFHGSRAVEILFKIFNRCQRARRVVVYSSDWGRTETTYDFETFAHGRHLAPALRELGLAISENDLGPVLRAAFPDVVLHTLAASIRKPDLMPLLTSALLPGVGALVAFELYERHRVEVRGEDGRIRRLQCMRHEEDSDFVFADVWKYLSIHYNLHKTVREIRTTRWESTEVFGDHPPQLQDEITLVLESPWIATPIIDVGSDIKIMRIPGLAKVEFLGALFLASLLWMLAHIEPPNGRKVEICIRSRKVRAEDTKEDAFGAFQTALDGTLWIICSQCRSQSVH